MRTTITKLAVVLGTDYAIAGALVKFLAGRGLAHEVGKDASSGKRPSVIYEVPDHVEFDLAEPKELVEQRMKNKPVLDQPVDVPKPVAVQGGTERLEKTEVKTVHGLQPEIVSKIETEVRELLEKVQPVQPESVPTKVDEPVQQTLTEPEQEQVNEMEPDDNPYPEVCEPMDEVVESDEVVDWLEMQQNPVVDVVETIPNYLEYQEYLGEPIDINDWTFSVNV